MLDTIGAVVRGLRGGSQAAKACMIITRTTGREVHSGEIERLKETGATGSYSNEYELALSHMIIDCSDRYNILGELYAPLNHAVRDRVLRLYDSCESQGLIRSQYLRDEYQKIKALPDQSQHITEESTPSAAQEERLQQATVRVKYNESSKHFKKPEPIKKWKMVANGLLNKSTGELVPTQHLQKVTSPVPGYNIKSFDYSTFWVKQADIEG